MLERITLNPNVCNGKPTIRNMRFTVAQLFELLAAGMTTAEILEDYPFIEAEDIRDCFFYVVRMTNAKNIVPINR